MKKFFSSAFLFSGCLPEFWHNKQTADGFYWYFPLCICRSARMFPAFSKPDPDFSGWMFTPLNLLVSPGCTYL
jgi:hypothetical protein